METAVGAAVLPGLALGGVLAILGAWSRLARGSDLPHLGVGALGGVLALCALRLAATPAPLVLAAAAALGALVGAGALVLDARARAVPRTRPLLADVAVLAALLALAALLRPPTAIPLPFGPLGGQAGTGAAVVAAVAGSTGALALGSRRVAHLAPTLRWALAGAAAGVVVALASGGVSPAPLAFGGIVGLPDTAGLALRAAAVGLAARRDAVDAVAAGLALGVSEMVLSALVPLSGVALVPTAVALAVGLALHTASRPSVRA